MQYYSLNKKSVLASFREAVVNGQAPDGGLYFPRYVPKLPPDFMHQLKSKNKEQIAFEVMRPYVGDSLSEEDLYTICSESVNFDFPLVKVNEQISSLELFHGPTLAFKDVGAKFMSGCLKHFFRNQSWKAVVLVATSGDTGGAVAQSFFNAEGIDVVILFPSGKVSKIQEQQLCALGNNVTALEIQGTFDDCQRMVKQAFADEELSNKMQLISANSINVGRWLPQQFFYFYALQQWQDEEPPVISVPSGNFGNICAGLLAQQSGLPIKHFIAACNSNDAFTDYIHLGEFIPRAAVPTLSNAMDVGNPSNFKRLLQLFNNNHNRVRDNVSSFSINDAITLETMKKVYEKYHYVLDPHGAVAYYLLEKYIEQHPGNKGIFLETAHPIKFESVVANARIPNLHVPKSIKDIFKKERSSKLLKPEFDALKEFLFYTEAGPVKNRTCTLPL